MAEIRSYDRFYLDEATIEKEVLQIFSSLQVATYQSWIQDVNAIGRHDNLDVFSGFESYFFFKKSVVYAHLCNNFKPYHLAG